MSVVVGVRIRWQLELRRGLLETGGSQTPTSTFIEKFRLAPASSGQDKCSGNGSESWVREQA